MNEDMGGDLGPQPCQSIGCDNGYHLSGCVFGSTMARAEQLDRGLTMGNFSANALTREQATIVGHWRRWLQGARDVWDDEGNDVVRITQGE